MELLFASAIGLLTAAGLYMVLRLRTFPVIVGTALLSYAVNLFLFASGRLTRGAPPILSDATTYTDPLPQALVLTAIVIGFGMTAVVVLIALGAYLESDSDDVNMDLDAPPPDDLLPDNLKADNVKAVHLEPDDLKADDLKAGTLQQPEADA